MAADQPGKKRRYLSQAKVPRHSITEALRIARAIADNYGKQPTRPLEVAAAMDMSPTSSRFRTLAGASVAYGFTDGGPNADVIGLTDVGRRVVVPTEEGNDLAAKREALLRPEVVRQFLQKYDGSRLPARHIGRNVLEGMGVPEEGTERTLDLIIESAEALGLLQEIKDQRYVNLQGVQPPPTEEGEAEGEEAAPPELPGEEEEEAPPPPPEKKLPNAIFIGHGKAKKPLDQLTKTLEQLAIPYKVATDEANVGRPISQKVKETMEECGAAILVFSADEEFFDKEGESIWRPSENVVHELGAASVLYENRIIIFKEERVQLATNFRDIGYISFEKDKLDAKVNELLRELLAFKILKVSVGE